MSPAIIAIETNSHRLMAVMIARLTLLKVVVNSPRHATPSPLRRVVLLAAAALAHTASRNRRAAEAQRHGPCPRPRHRVVIRAEVVAAGRARSPTAGSATDPTQRAAFGTDLTRSGVVAADERGDRSAPSFSGPR
jgi:hypothetical protein